MAELYEHVNESGTDIEIDNVHVLCRGFLNRFDLYAVTGTLASWGPPKNDSRSESDSHSTIDYVRTITVPGVYDYEWDDESELLTVYLDGSGHALPTASLIAQKLHDIYAARAETEALLLKLPNPRS